MLSPRDALRVRLSALVVDLVICALATFAAVAIAFLVFVVLSERAGAYDDPAAVLLPVRPTSFDTRTSAARLPAKPKGRRGGRTRTIVQTGCLPAKVRQVLATIERRWGHNKITSTHRPGATVRNTGRPSFHATCRAVDFYPAPGTKRAVYRWLNANWSGGLGTYDRAPFFHLHIDDGPRRRWRN